MEEEYTIEDFYADLWGQHVSEKVVPTQLIQTNQEFIDEITYELFRLHENAKIPLNILSRIAEAFIKNMRIYQPKC